MTTPPPGSIGYQSPSGFPAAEAPGIDASGTIVIDVPCRKCGFNVRGLYVAGRCPECGTPVGLSVQGPLLRYSDPNWIDTLRRGINFILAGIVVIILIFLASMGLAFAGLDQRTLQLISGGMGVVSSIFFVLGGWLLTAPDPSGIGEDEYGTPRKLIRMTLAIGVLNQVLTLGDQFSVPPPAVHQTIIVIAGLAGLAGVVGQFAQLLYLSRLAMRIPDDALAARARFLMWAIGITYGMLIVLGLVLALSMRRGMAAGGPPGGVMALGCVAALVGLALIVFGIMYLFMLERLGKRFKQEGQVARQIWSGSGAAPA